jgi:SAM-dependent methyltransferase
MGWLSNRLVEQGYRTISVDLNLDSTFGLGAIALHFAEVTGIQPLQATLDHVPFRKEALSLVIANASLHYASDVRGCVQRIAASLAPNGIFIILDTPIAKFPRPGVHLGDTLIGEKDLRLALEGAGLLVRVRHPFRGFRWLAFQARRWVRRRPHFTLPLLTAVKANAGS